MLAYRINAAGRQVLAAGMLAKRAKGQHAALGILAQAAGALSVSELAQQGVSSAVARALAQTVWQTRCRSVCCATATTLCRSVAKACS